ncbi:glycosyltransferase family 4 protein [Bacillus sp. JJ1764]|uniref:glycosyltransferase family 4 protein n=1 Tax=Bacillus sp. JJ1764 TaxID=3122964 RepID=UPI002FFD80ED
MNRSLIQDEIKVRAVGGWKLKILLLCWEYPPNVVGGLSRHVHGLGVHMANQGHEVHILTAGNGNLPSEEIVDDVRIHRVTPINDLDDDFLSWVGGLNLAMAFKAEMLSDEINFDLIHAHDWLIGAAAIHLKNSLSIPLLTTIHATEHGRSNGTLNQWQKFIHEKECQLIEHSDHIIVCSEYMKETLLSVFAAANEPIAVIPNGIDEPIVKFRAGDLFPELNGKKFIFSVGRMVKEKGFETIIEAAEISRETNQDYFFLIGGKGPMLDSYQKMITEKDLQDYISFTGYLSDEQKNALLADCELAVFPSLYEPFGIVALEAMVHGKATIVSNTGGLKGIIKHEYSGLLMEPGDARSMLEQIAFLSHHPRMSAEIGNNGRDVVKSLYGWKRIACETARVMEDVVLKSRINEEMELENQMIRRYGK